MQFAMRGLGYGRQCRSCYVGVLILDTPTKALWICRHCLARVGLYRADEETR